VTSGGAGGEERVKGVVLLVPVSACVQCATFLVCAPPCKPFSSGQDGDDIYLSGTSLTRQGGLEGKGHQTLGQERGREVGRQPTRKGWGGTRD
jgi:hypothetical protein